MTDSQPDLGVVWLSGVTTRLEKWRGSEGSAFLGFEWVQFFSFRTHFHETVARVGVEAAPPSDPEV